jgi:ATP-dependent Clp protease protease subunit
MNQARNRLLALLATNQAKPKRYEIQARQDANEATIYIYDVISSDFGVGAAQFVKDLSALKSGTIHLRINSPGGDVFEGRAMATAIAQHPAKIIAHIDGLAASAASYVAIAADEVEMAPGSFFMIHRAWSIAYGNAADMRETADVLEKIDEALVADYVKQSGQTEEQVRAWLDAETWFSADETVANGFADRLSDAEKVSNAWDLSVYAQAPKAEPEPEPEDFEGAERLRRFAFLEKVA